MMKKDLKMRLQLLYIIYRQNTMTDSYVNTEEANCEEENIKMLQNNFTLDDYLEYDETREILHQNFD